MISGIYKIINSINNKIYIGSSKNIKNRFRQHLFLLRHNKHFNSHLQSAYNKYGEASFVFEIIEECKTNIIDSREEYWIKALNSNISGIGYNMRIECHTNKGKKRTPEQIERHRQTQIGKKQSAETIERRKQSMLANKVNGKIRKIGWKLSQEVIANRLICQGKKVSKFTMSGEFIENFGSCTEAGNTVGGTSSGVSSVCSGKRKSYRGFIWRYTDQLKQGELLENPTQNEGQSAAKLN